jgi:acetoin utilization deacetylase AcuC-like enzyme
MAVTIRALQQDGRVRRVAILDLDVHQGDGTASLLAGDPEVLTVSVHGARNFPFRKQRSSLDLELPDGATDEQYLALLPAAVGAVVEWRPEIVFFQSGVDALDSDRLGRLRMTLAGLGQRDRLVFETVWQHRLPIVTVLGGGYSQPVERTAEAHANTFLTAASVFGMTR